MPPGYFHCCHVFVLLLMLYYAECVGRTEICRPGYFGSRCRYECHCARFIPCDPTSGRCPQGCQAGWSGINCQTENVALNEKSRQRTTYKKNSAGLAVDWMLVEETCAMTRPNHPGSWQVDLGQTYDLYKIFLKTKGKKDLRNVRVYISDASDLSSSSLCGTVSLHTDQSIVTCELPLSGRYVHVVNTNQQLILCDVHVYVCSDYRFGRLNCDGRCHCEDESEICNKVTGSCTSGCEAGWGGDNCQTACNATFGPGCRSQCGHCRSGMTCDPRSGVCSGGCAAGWRGKACDLNCVPGSYGRGCVYMCGHCLHTTCDPVLGTCPRGCEAGWMGSKCSVPCPDQRYGENCAFRCGSCRNKMTCDSETGVCSQGCAEGWRGVFCSLECRADTYGLDCKEKCGNCNSGSCNLTSGDCDDGGCKQGWSGPKCNQKCMFGMYGKSCDQECGNCKDHVTCDPQGGTCPTGCADGWTGPYCKTKCKRGFYGEDCDIACGVCMEGMACHHITGKCPGDCAHGYSGPLCQDKLLIDPTKNLLTSVVVGTGSIVFASLIVFIICMVTRWRQDNIQDDGEQDEKRLQRRTPLLKRLDSGEIE